MKFSVYLLLLTSLGLGTAQAQTTFHFGPRLGGNLGSGNFSHPEIPVGPGATYTLSQGHIGGVQLGVAASIGRGHWAFQPALLFTQKGMTQQLDVAATSAAGDSYREHDEVSSRVHYLELPLNVVYSLGRDGQGLQVFAGPYVALGVGGRASYTAQADLTSYGYTQHFEESRSLPFTFGSEFDDSQNGSGSQARARQFDAGLTAGVGYRRGPVQVQLGYGLGLLNVQPDYPASYQLPNDTGYLRTVQLTATYFLDHWPAARK